MTAGKGSWQLDDTLWILDPTKSPDYWLVGLVSAPKAVVAGVGETTSMVLLVPPGLCMGSSEQFVLAVMVESRLLDAGFLAGKFYSAEVWNLLPLYQERDKLVVFQFWL